MDVLSQEEINALLNEPDGSAGESAGKGNTLSDTEKDAIGEIANISMGTAATTLFSLVNRKVEISTPVVSVSTWEDVVENYEKPCVFIKIAYTVGLDGSNILVLKENDVKVITDLMMGGDGTNIDGELGELHLSAISEAMNQMMGSSATSLSSTNIIDLTQTVDEGEIDEFLSGEFVKISFKMEIGDLVDSEIMQLYPFSFAREMYESFQKNMAIDSDSIKEDAEPETATSTNKQAASNQQNQQMRQQQMGQQMSQPMMGQQQMGQPQVMGHSVNVQPAQFSAFGAMPNGTYQPENIDLIMDVPLEVTVELGRTSKSISEILDFAPGKIIELNKLAGEPIDVLVNGKYVAKGEVVVIEESFGVRITEIVNAPLRINQ